MGENGTMRQRRPQLHESIERLDEMIDGLAVAIPGAVADALRAALGPAFAAAIKDAVTAAVKKSGVKFMISLPSLTEKARTVLSGQPTETCVPSGENARPYTLS